MSAAFEPAETYPRLNLHRRQSFPDRIAQLPRGWRRSLFQYCEREFHRVFHWGRAACQLRWTHAFAHQRQPLLSAPTQLVPRGWVRRSFANSTTASGRSV